jgi:hypothetical protein
MTLSFFLSILTGTKFNSARSNLPKDEKVALKMLNVTEIQGNSD